MLKFLRVLFATSGDRTAIPDAADPGGAVSYTEGYGFDYQRQETDPNTKNIERDKMNALFYDITGAIRELQSQGIPDFITTALNGGVAYSYSQNAIVRYSGANYISLVDTNTATPADATKWALMPTAAAIQSETFAAAVAGGTSNTITANFTPAITAYPGAPNTLRVLVRALSTSTIAAPTFAPNGLAAKSIVKFGNNALVPGDVAGVGHWLELVYDATLDKWVLLNPGQGALFVANGSGSVLRNQKDKLRDFVNTKDFGAATGNTDAQNKTALQAAITAVDAAGGGTIIVDYDVPYGFKTRTPSTWPDFTGTTKPIMVRDWSRGKTQDPNVYPTSYDGMQGRFFSNTPQTTSPGQHDGNVISLRANWNPQYATSNDANLAAVGNPARTAFDNYRNGFSTGTDGYFNWAFMNGNLAGAGFTREELSNLQITKFSAPGDTLGDYTPFLVERKTGSISYGKGQSVPAARHHFGPVSGSPTADDMMLESAGSEMRYVMRTNAGAAQDIVLRNAAGVFGVNVPAIGDAIQVQTSNRRTWISGSLQLRRQSLTYGTNVATDTTQGNIFTVTVTNGTAFNITQPSGPTDGSLLTYTIRNTSGGAMGVITWSSVFKMSAWTNPANGFSRSITFYFDGTNWIEISRDAADIPN